MNHSAVPLFIRIVARTGAVASALLCLAGGSSLQAASPIVAIKAAKIFVGNGQSIEHGVLLVENGRVTAVGPDVSVPDGAKLLDFGAAQLTPGLIDADAQIGSARLIAPSRLPPEPDALDGGIIRQAATSVAAPAPRPGVSELGQSHAAAGDSPAAAPLHVGEELPDDSDAPFAAGVAPQETVNEQSSEVVPYTNLLDGLNLESEDLVRLAHGGVTTAYASPDPSAVIGARGAIVHTQGPIDQRVLVEKAAVKATVGSEPGYLGSREPDSLPQQCDDVCPAPQFPDGAGVGFSQSVL